MAPTQALPMHPLPGEQREAVVKRQQSDIPSARQGASMRFYVSQEWLSKFNTFTEPGPPHQPPFPLLPWR